MIQDARIDLEKEDVMASSFDGNTFTSQVKIEMSYTSGGWEDGTAGTY